MAKKQPTAKVAPKKPTTIKAKDKKPVTKKPQQTKAEEAKKKPVKKKSTPTESTEAKKTAVTKEPLAPGLHYLMDLSPGDTFQFTFGDGTVVEQLEGFTTRVEMNRNESRLSGYTQVKNTTPITKISTAPLLNKKHPNQTFLKDLIVGEKFYCPETGHAGHVLRLNDYEVKVRVTRGADGSAECFWAPLTVVVRGTALPLSNNTATTTNEATTPAPKQAKTKQPKAEPTSSESGHRGRYDLFGMPVTGVLRWMGVQGWDRKRARAVLDANGCSSVSDTTIGIQLNAGKKNQKPPAEVSAEVAKKLSSIKA